jgi:FlaA1/EpsC-like NDP-sugar epimerase
MKGKLTKYLLLLADLAAIVLAFRVAYFLRYETGFFRSLSQLPTPPFAAYDYAIMLSLGTWVLIFLLYGANHFPALGQSPLAGAKLITASVFLIGSLLAGMYLAKAFYSRLLLLFLSVLVLLFLVATRAFYQILLKRLRKYGLGVRRVVIVGHSELASELAGRIEKRLDLHYELVGYLAPTAGRIQDNGHAASGGGEPVLSESESMARGLAALNVDELLFAIPIRRQTETLEFIAHCQKVGITIKCVPEYYDLHTSHPDSGDERSIASPFAPDCKTDHRSNPGCLAPSGDYATYGRDRHYSPLGLKEGDEAGGPRRTGWQAVHAVSL